MGGVGGARRDPDRAMIDSAQVLSERDFLAMARAREAEIADLLARGKIVPEDLRHPAWATVATVMLQSKSARTRLMAARLVVERTDPVPREPEDETAARPSRGVIFNLTVIQQQLAPTNGHVAASDAGTQLRPHGVELRLGDGGGEGA